MQLWSTFVMPEDDQHIPSGFAKFLSFEMFALFMGMAVLWGTFTASVTANEEDIAELQDEQEKIEEGVEGLRTSIELIRAEQNHIKDDLDEQKTISNEILRLLREQVNAEVDP